MPLNVAQLTSDIEAALEKKGKLDVIAGDLAAAYKNYAAGAMSCGGGTPQAAMLTAAEATLKAALISAFAGRSPNTSGTANAIAAAYAAFWIAPPIVFQAPIPGLVTVAAPGAMASALSSSWASVKRNKSKAAAAAQAQANALHAFTLTVVVAHPLVPTPCALPIA